MKQIAIIILNYKTWELTLELITKIQQTPEIYRICDLIVVDNCSPNNAYKELSQESAALNYILLGNTSNTGYAAGNNIGLRYAYKQGYEFAWILNNDILLEDSDILNKMVSIFEEAKDVAAISPDIYMPGGYLCNRESIRPGVWEMSLGAISYRKRGREGLEKGKSWLYVYRPQ